VNDYRPGDRVLVTAGHDLAGQRGIVTDAGTDKHIVTIDGVEHAIGADHLLPIRTPARHAHAVQVERPGDNRPGHLFQTARVTVATTLIVRPERSTP
jgi:hypothetical protein